MPLFALYGASYGRRGNTILAKQPMLVSSLFHRVLEVANPNGDGDHDGLDHVRQPACHFRPDSATRVLFEGISPVEPGGFSGWFVALPEAL